MVSELLQWIFATVCGFRICHIAWDGYDVDLFVRDNATHRDVMLLACEQLKLSSHNHALLLRDGQGTAPLDRISTFAFTLVKRDRVGGQSDVQPLKLEPWDIKTYRRVVNHLESCTQEGNERLRLFLSWINYDNPLGESLLEAVHSVRRCSKDDLYARWFSTEDRAKFNTANEETLRWSAIKCELKKLIPQESTLAPLEYLKGMNKKPSETLLDFVTRFGRAWKHYHDEGKVSEKNATHVLLQKLPPDFIYHLSSIPFADVTIQKIYEKAVCVMDYLRLRSREIAARPKIDDYMDVDSAKLMMGDVTESTDEHCAAIRDTLLPNGKPHFPITLNSKNQVMVIYKELIKEDRFFQESQRAVKAEQERRRNKKEPRVATCSNEEDGESPRLCKVEREDRCESSLQPLVCRSAQKKKSSMHAKVTVNGRSISALVDTGATDNFIQEATVKALGLASALRPSHRYITLANGQRDKIVGHVTFKATLADKELEMDAYCFKGKGEAMMIGFGWLEENEVVLDCGAKTLSSRTTNEVQCYQMDTKEQKNEEAPSVVPAHPRA